MVQKNIVFMGFKDSILLPQELLIIASYALDKVPEDMKSLALWLGRPWPEKIESREIQSLVSVGIHVPFLGILDITLKYVGDDFP